MKLILMILFMLSFLKLNAQDEIILKNSNIVNGKIESVRPWGLILDTQKSIHYKVIASIKTKNFHVVNKIVKYLSELKPELLPDSIYYLEFRDYVIQQNSFQNSLQYSYKINKAKLTFLYSSTISENFEIKLKYVPGIANYLFLQMAFTTGTYSGQKEFTGNNFYKTDFETFAFNIGLGCQIEFDKHNFYTGINYSAKSISFSAKEINSKARRENNSFLGMGFVFHFAKKYHVTIGCKYHWPKIELFPDHSRISVNGGIGFSLLKF